MYYIEKKPAKEVAERFGYTYRAFTSLIALFLEKLAKNPTGTFFFAEHSPAERLPPKPTNRDPSSSTCGRNITLLLTSRLPWTD